MRHTSKASDERLITAESTQLERWPVFRFYGREPLDRTYLLSKFPSTRLPQSTIAALVKSRWQGYNGR